MHTSAVQTKTVQDLLGSEFLSMWKLTTDNIFGLESRGKGVKPCSCNHICFTAYSAILTVGNIVS